MHGSAGACRTNGGSGVAPLHTANNDFGACAEAAGLVAGTRSL